MFSLKSSLLSSLLLATAAAASQDIAANSNLGKRLLSKARPYVRGEGDTDVVDKTVIDDKEREMSLTMEHITGDEGRSLQNNNYYTSWMSGYSLKFAGCHHVPQFERDEGLTTMLLARFYLCSNSGSCSRCTDHGEYIVEMRDFVEAYREAQMTAHEYECETQQSSCEYMCENGQYNQNDDNNYNNNGGNYNNYNGNNNNNYNYNNNNNNNGDNRDYCEYQCMVEAGMSYCQNDGGQDMNYEEFTECRQLGGEGGNNRNNYNYGDYDGNNNNQYSSYRSYWTGAYCTSDGVYLGIFSDSMCSSAAPTGTFEKYMGYSLPTDPIVTTDCISCGVSNYNQNANNNGGDNYNGNYNNGNNNNYNYGVNEVCEKLYEDAGKCEKNLHGAGSYKNNNACSLIHNTLRKLDNAFNAGHSIGGDGFQLSTFFAWTLLVVALGMGGYIYFLHTRIIGSVDVADMASNYFGGKQEKVNRNKNLNPVS